jgi:hypothetical protein
VVYLKDNFPLRIVIELKRDHKNCDDDDDDDDDTTQYKRPLSSKICGCIKLDYLSPINLCVLAFNVRTSEQAYH